MDQSAAVEMTAEMCQRNTSFLQSLNAEICSSTGSFIGFQREKD